MSNNDKVTQVGPETEVGAQPWRSSLQVTWPAAAGPLASHVKAPTGWAISHPTRFTSPLVPAILPHTPGLSCVVSTTALPGLCFKGDEGWKPVSHFCTQSCSD